MVARSAIVAPHRFEVHTETGRRILLDRIDALENGFAVEVRPIERHDTRKQRRLYNAWISDISKYSGDGWACTDKFIRRELLPVQHEIVCGKKVPRLTDIEDLETDEMSDLLEQLQAYNAGEIGANLRDPAEYRKKIARNG